MASPRIPKNRSGLTEGTSALAELLPRETRAGLASASDDLLNVVGRSATNSRTSRIIDIDDVNPNGGGINPDEFDRVGNVFRKKGAAKADTVANIGNIENKAAPFAMPQVSGSKRLEGVLDTAQDLTTKVGMGALIVTPVLGGLTKAFAWTTRKTGIAPKFGQAVRDSVVGTESAAGFTNMTVADAGQKLGGVGKAIGGATQSTFDNVLAPAAEKAVKVTGLSRFQHGRHLSRATRKFTQTMALLTGLTPTLNIANAPSELHAVVPHIETSLGLIRNAPNVASLAANPAFKDVHEQIEKILESDSAVARALRKHKPLQQAYKVSQKAAEAVTHHTDAHAWTQVGQTVKNVPKAIAKSSMTHGVMTGAFIAGDAVGLATAATQAVGNTASLAQMERDISGRNVGLWDMVTGNVSQPVKQKFRQEIPRTLIKFGVGAASLMLNIKNATRPVSMWKFLAPAGVSLGANLALGDSSLSVFDEFSGALAANKDVPAEIYAKYIAAVDPQFERLGAKNAITLKVGQQLKDGKFNAGQIEGMVSSGKLAEMGASAAALVDASRPAMPVAGKHVANLNRKDPAHMAIKGPHTNRLAAAQNMPAAGIELS